MVGWQEVHCYEVAFHGLRRKPPPGERQIRSSCIWWARWTGRSWSQALLCSPYPPGDIASPQVVSCHARTPRSVRHRVELQEGWRAPGSCTLRFQHRVQLGSDRAPWGIWRMSWARNPADPWRVYSIPIGRHSQSLSLGWRTYETVAARHLKLKSLGVLFPKEKSSAQRLQLWSNRGYTAFLVVHGTSSTYPHYPTIDPKIQPWKTQHQRLTQNRSKSCTPKTPCESVPEAPKTAKCQRGGRWVPPLPRSHGQKTCF